MDLIHEGCFFADNKPAIHKKMLLAASGFPQFQTAPENYGKSRSNTTTPTDCLNLNNRGKVCKNPDLSPTSKAHYPGTHRNR